MRTPTRRVLGRTVRGHLAIEIAKLVSQKVFDSAEEIHEQTKDTTKERIGSHVFDTFTHQVIAALVYRASSNHC